MDVFSLMLSDLVAKVSTDTLATYLLMLSDIERNSTVTTKFFKNQNKLISGFGVQSISQALNLPELTVSRGISQLIRIGWIRQIKIDKGPAYQLGEIDNGTALWFISIERKTEHTRSASETIKMYIREKKAREPIIEKKLSRDVRMKVAEKLMVGVELPRNPSKRILNYFLSRYLNKFDVRYVISEEGEGSREYIKAIAYVKKYLSYCDNSYTTGVELLDFIFSDWETISKKLAWVGRPSLSLIATAKIVRTLRDWKNSGIPKVIIPEDRVAKRYDTISAKEVPEVGF